MKTDCRWVVLTVLIGNVLSSSAAGQEKTDTDAEIRELKQRVSQLEAELKAIRKGFAALNAALNAKTDTKPIVIQPSKSLNIEVIDKGWGKVPTRDIQKVCLSAAQEIWIQFPGQTIDPITIRHSVDGPMVVYGKGTRGERRVLLHINGTYWAQFSFQFAHELCHILCNYRNARNPHMWFEESLCETASLFALKRMEETWKTDPPYPNWKNYSVSLGNYARDRLKTAQLPKEMSFAQWFRENQDTLRGTATDRAKNLLVAAALLPLLEAKPEHWQAVRFLNQWDAAKPLSFEQYILDWHQRVPDNHKPFVRDVASLFEFSVTP